MANDREIDYAPAGPVIKAFHQSEAFVRGIMGPIGSGKSTACVIEILRRAQMQKPGPDGIRRTRFAIIRNSYPELKTTTLKTWLSWVPAEYGKLTHDSPLKHHITTPDLDIEVLFLALDREEDARKLLSLELTGAWINEAREVPKTILDALTGRVGRYPSMSQGGCTWSGIVLDTNPPDDQHFWYQLAEGGSTPKGWEFFSQPAGDGPDAENLANLPKNYYDRVKAGKDEDFIKVYVRGAYGYVAEGKPVFPMFRDRVHTAAEPIKAVGGLPLLIGVDFGLTPAAVIAQKLPDGRWGILDELITEDCGVIRFAEMLGAYIARHYAGSVVASGWGDPAGATRGYDEKTALDIMRQYTGWQWRPAPSNDPTMRLEVVSAALNRMVDGNPGILISPTCKTIRKGFSGGYHYKSVRSGNGAQYHDKPNKNQYSHPMDALQYLLLGGGEHHVVMARLDQRQRRANRPRVAADVDYDLFA